MYFSFSSSFSFVSVYIQCSAVQALIISFFTTKTFKLFNHLVTTFSFHFTASKETDLGAFILFDLKHTRMNFWGFYSGGSRIYRRRRSQPHKGGANSQYGYVSKNVYVKTKGLGLLGGAHRVRPLESANVLDFLFGLFLPVIRNAIKWSYLFGLSKERPILGDHPQVHIHEIRRILWIS